MLLRARYCNLLATLTGLALLAGMTSSAQAYSFRNNGGSLDRADPKTKILAAAGTANLDPTRRYQLVDEVQFSDLDQLSIAMSAVKQMQSMEPKNGYEVFSPSETQYEEFDRAVQSEVQKGVPVYNSQQEFIFGDKVSVYEVNTVITPDGKLISTLEKISGEEGPPQAAGVTNVEQNLEVLFKQGQQGVVKDRVIVPADSSREQVNQLLQPLVEQNYLKPLQVEGWVGTEVFLDVQEAKQNPEVFLGEPTPIGEEIALPNNLGSSIYEGTGISLATQSQNKANVALLSLISEDGQPVGTQPDLERGIEKVLAYAKENPPTTLNPRRTNSSYAKEIRQASTFEDLTEIFNRAGRGRGIVVDINDPKQRQWLFTSVDRKSIHYIGNVFGKEPTGEQVNTALHIKEILRASGIDYVQQRLGLDTSEKLSGALMTSIPGIHPDVANGVGEYLTTKVSDPYCEDNGFCSDLNIPTQATLEVKTAEQDSENLVLNQTYYYSEAPGELSPVGAPVGGAAGIPGGAILGGVGGIAGIALIASSGGGDSGGGPGSPTNPTNPTNPTQPQPKEIPEPGTTAGLFGIASLLGVSQLLKLKKQHVK